MANIEKTEAAILDGPHLIGFTETDLQGGARVTYGHWLHDDLGGQVMLVSGRGKISRLQKHFRDEGYRRGDPQWYDVR